MKTCKQLTYIILISAALFAAACDGTSTDEYLNGDFIDVTNDTTPPDAILPVASEKVTASPVVLQWTSKKGASYYTVEVTRNIDANFSTQISGSPFTVNAPDTVLSLDLPVQSSTYCWRVRADVTASGQYGQSSFESMDDTVYVYCPADVEEPDNTGMAGNISKPFQTIMRGIAEADRLNLSNVKIAARQLSSGIHTSYQEIIILKDGIDLFGAYTPDFTGVDVDNNKTILQGSNGYTVIAFNMAETTVLAGFEINGSKSRTTRDSYAIHVSNCFTGGLNIRSNTISGISMTTLSDCSSYGIYLENAGATIFDNTITGGDAANSYGIMVNIGNVTITDNTITAGAGDSASYGIYNNGESVIMGNNINNVTTPAESNNSYGIYNTSGVWISENTITGGPAIGESCGMYNTGWFCNTIVLNNLIMSGMAVDSYGMKNENNSAPVLYNNTIIGGEASHESCGLLNNGAPVTIINNIFTTEDNAGTSYGYDGVASTHSNNCFWALAGLPYDTNDLTLDKTEIVINPEFDDDYRLTDKSDEQLQYGAMNLSYTLGVLAVEIFNIKSYNPIDRDGIDRSSNDGWSMGAFEYQAD